MPNLQKAKIAYAGTIAYLKEQKEAIMQQWKAKKHEQKHTFKVVQRVKLVINDRAKTDKTFATNGAALVDAMVNFDKEGVTKARLQDLKRAGQPLDFGDLVERELINESTVLIKLYQWLYFLC